MKEPVRLAVSCCVGHQVYSSQSGLLTAGRKHNQRLSGGMLQDGVLGGLGHGDDPAGTMVHFESLNVQLQRDWSHIGVEIECTVGGAAQPLGDILAVTQTAGEGQDTSCSTRPTCQGWR